MRAEAGAAGGGSSSSNGGGGGGVEERQTGKLQAFAMTFRTEKWFEKLTWQAYRLSRG
jgi:hypothetical protein